MPAVSFHHKMKDILCMVVMVGVATIIGYVFRSFRFPETNIVVVYILSVILTARLTDGYAYGIAATVLSTCAFNIFFTSPYYTLSVDDPTYLITFSIMAATSVITSALTSKEKQMTADAVRKEQESGTLYYLTSHLADAESINSIASITVSSISTIMECKAACLCFDEKGMPERTFIQQKNEHEQIRRSVKDPDALTHRIENLRMDYDENDEFYDWPIYGSESILGVVRIPKERASSLNEQQKRLLHAMIECVSLAMDRLRVMQEKIRSQEEANQERYRGNLLRAISHDLRTPLAGIMGTSEMIMDMSEQNEPRYELAQGIYKDADWLRGLVENILSLTRLQDGRLTLHKQMEPVEEVIGAALNVIAKRAPEREITVDIPDEIVMVPMDVGLIEQVLTNLLDNAIKHTQVQDEIIVAFRKDEQSGQAVFTVSDHGTGILDEDLPKIFEMFYTTKGSGPDARRGIGLGLAICESIIRAHGGTITASNQKTGTGAVFEFTLPLEESE